MRCCPRGCNNLINKRGDLDARPRHSVLYLRAGPLVDLHRALLHDVVSSPKLGRTNLAISKGVNVNSLAHSHGASPLHPLRDLGPISGPSRCQLHREGAAGHRQQDRVMAEPVAAQAGVGNILILKERDDASDKWNEPLLEQLCTFPNASHDDWVDALSDAFDELTNKKGATSIAGEW